MNDTYWQNEEHRFWFDYHLKFWQLCSVPLDSNRPAKDRPRRGPRHGYRTPLNAARRPAMIPDHFNSENDTANFLAPTGSVWGEARLYFGQFLGNEGNASESGVSPGALQEEILALLASSSGFVIVFTLGGQEGCQLFSASRVSGKRAKDRNLINPL